MSMSCLRRGNPTFFVFGDYAVATWVDYGALYAIGLWNHHLTTGPKTIKTQRLIVSLICIGVAVCQNAGIYPDLLKQIFGP